MVMPRSFSMSILSSTWLDISRAVRPPVDWMSRSASVDLPWSIWAMIEKLRMRERSVICGRVSRALREAEGEGRGLPHRHRHRRRGDAVGDDDQGGGAGLGTGRH